MQKTAENKISPLFLENPFEKKLTELEKTHHQLQNETKLDRMFRPKTFEERWRFCNHIAIIVGYVCNYFSSITAFSLLFYLCFLALSPIMGSLLGIALSLLPSLVVVGAIEVVKRHTSANFLQDIIQFKKFRFGLLVFLVACCTFSIGTSFLGAKEIPKYFPAPEPMHLNSLYNLDSTLHLAALSYDEEIRLQKVRIDSFEIANTNSKGSIRYGAIKTHGMLQEELTELNREKRAALGGIQAQYQKDKETAIAQDKEEIKANQDEKTKISSMLGVAAILCELLFFICMTGHWWFSWKAQKERYLEQPLVQNTVENNDNHNDNGNDNRQSVSEVGQQRIGFKQQEIKENDNHNDNRHPQLPTCQNPNCNKQYLPRHKKQKYCCEECRKEAWQINKGKKLIIKKKS